MGNSGKKFLLVLGDLFFMFLSLFLMMLWREKNLWDSDTFLQYFAPFSLIFFSWSLNLYAWNFYDLASVWRVRNYIYAFVINMVIAMVFFYAWPSLVITPKTNLVITGLFFTGFFFAWRFLLQRSFAAFGKDIRVLIIGANAQNLGMMQTFQKNPWMGFHIAAILKRPEESVPEWVQTARIPVYRETEMLNEYCLKHEIAMVVVNEGWFHEIFRDLFKLLPMGIRVRHVASFCEDEAQFIPIYNADEIWFLQNLTYTRSPFADFLKRFADLVMALILLVPGIPLGLISALMVWSTSKGPMLYSQIRTGLNGKPFRIYKFRSMYIDAEKRGAQWATKNDPRVTPVGRFLRKTRLDEIPQLINILKGDMSFVGPRPERPEFETDLTEKIPYYSLRHLMKPGLTGWAQVNYPYGASVEDAAHKLEYDLYYLKNKGLILDAKTVLKTVKVVISRGGQ